MSTFGSSYTGYITGFDIYTIGCTFHGVLYIGVEKHLFGFEITWAIGDESNATETCLFYDGKVHKIGAVDVEKFPKNRFMEPWKFISEDGRFNMTMTPTLDNHTDVDFKVGRMNCHQIFGNWNGTMTLDDGKVIEIKDLFTFCEYVENRW